MKQSEPSYRVVAAIVTAVSAITLFAFGLVLQLMTYELFESYSEYELPTISKPLFENFGFRATDFLIHTTFWLWWPFVWAFVHTHFYYPNNEVFARVYASRLILCVAFVALYAAIYALAAATPRILFLADLSHEPSAVMKLIPVISRILPVLVVAFTAHCAYKTTAVFRDKDGILRMTNKADRHKYT